MTTLNWKELTFQELSQKPTGATDSGKTSFTGIQCLVQFAVVGVVVAADVVVAAVICCCCCHLLLLLLLLLCFLCANWHLIQTQL